METLDETRDKDAIASWYEEARKQTPETLAAFFEKVMGQQHDYGTVCHAIAAVAVGAAWAGDKHPQGGITGFQAGAVFWQFAKHWHDVTGPARLVRFENMLFPQYEDSFQKTIGKETWEWLQEEAKKKLATEDRTHIAPAVVEHWESIAAGRVPFGYEVRDA